MKKSETILLNYDNFVLMSTGITGILIKTAHTTYLFCGSIIKLNLGSAVIVGPSSLSLGVRHSEASHPVDR